MPARRPKKPLTRQRIVTAALAIIDADGLDALSMRRLGRELSVDPMAIYHHVPSKSALYDAIMDDVIGPLADVDLPHDLPFEDFVLEAGRLYRRVLLEHARALPLLTSRPLRTEHTLAVAERLLARFVEIGLGSREAMAALNAFGQYIAGAANTYAQHVMQTEYHEDVPVHEMAANLDPDHFPTLLRIIGEDASIDFEAPFEFAMRALARGFVAMAAKRGAPSTP
jgi:TetR/AcrR family transcriptional regulator, tetracycline repressor protein